MLTIREATTPDDQQAVAALVRELMVEEYGIPSDHRHVQSIALPGEFAPPDGALLLAADGPRAAGCVLLRRLGADTCEMKRLYVRPAFRAAGLGRRLVEELIQRAAGRGYRTMRLITVGRLASAARLYRRLGFVEIPHYTDDLPPEPDVISMERRLGE